MNVKTKQLISSGFLVVGLFVLGLGIYELGYHNGMEVIRTNDSGLGGFAEWAGSWIEIAIGVATMGIGLAIKVNVNNRR